MTPLFWRPRSWGLPGTSKGADGGRPDLMVKTSEPEFCSSAFGFVMLLRASRASAA